MPKIMSGVPAPETNNDYDAFNAAFLFNPEGRCAAVYHKQKLVIFGEYIPLVRWLPFIKWFTPITGSFASGDRAVPFEMDYWSAGLRPGTNRMLIFTDAGSETGAPDPRQNLHAHLFRGRVPGTRAGIRRRTTRIFW